MVTPHYLKDMDVMCLIPEYDEEGQFVSLQILEDGAKDLRIKPMLNLSTEIPYLEIEELNT